MRCYIDGIEVEVSDPALYEFINKTMKIEAIPEKNQEWLYFL